MNYRPNVWLGTTVENQEYAQKRIPELLKCRDLAPVLFVSCEPLLGPIDLTFIDSQYVIDSLRGTFSKQVAFADQMTEEFHDGGPKLDFVITGGESGPEARPTHPAWFRQLRDQCKAAGVAFHFKQMGEYIYEKVEGPINFLDGTPVDNERDEPMRPKRVGVKAAGRLLDGVLHDEFPVVRKAGV